MKKVEPKQSGSGLRHPKAKGTGREEFSNRDNYGRVKKKGDKSNEAKEGNNIKSDKK